MTECCNGMQFLVDHGSVHINGNNVEVLSTRYYKDDNQVGALHLVFCPICGKKRK